MLRGEMYKDELIYLHQFFIYLMRFLVDNGVSSDYFREYIELGISPHHIHRTKAEHKYALFLLASEISYVLAENNEIIPRGIAKKLKEIADRAKEDISK